MSGPRSPLGVSLAGLCPDAQVGSKQGYLRKRCFSRRRKLRMPLFLIRVCAEHFPGSASLMDSPPTIVLRASPRAISQHTTQHLHHTCQQIAKTDCELLAASLYVSWSKAPVFRLNPDIGSFFPRPPNISSRQWLPPIATAARTQRSGAISLNSLRVTQRLQQMVKHPCLRRIGGPNFRPIVCQSHPPLPLFLPDLCPDLLNKQTAHSDFRSG